MTAPHQNLLGMSGAVADTEETDPNFNQTVLLLHGDGTNGGQNNTFVDSSSSGHTITKNGNPTQGTFNPFLGEGYYSLFVSDTGQDARLEFADSTDFAFASGQAFTVECFIYLLQKTAGDHIYMTAANGGFALKIDSTGNNLAAGIYSGSEPSLTRVKGAVSIGTWHHIVYVRDSSNTASFFVDGTRTETTTDSTSYAQQAVRVGCTDVNPCHAYINNLRVTRSEVYDASSSSLTVPTTALSALADTVLLTCQSNRFLDNSSDARVPSIITNNDSPKIIPFSPFAPTASYSESVHGGSAFFDGNGDYLQVADSDDFNLGSGDFTIEFWHYATVHNAQNIYLGQWQGSNYSFTIITSNDAEGKLRYIFSSNGTGGFDDQTSTVAYPTHAWRHVALVRQNNTMRLYQNGVQIHTSSYSSTLYNSTANLGIGAAGNGGYQTEGYFANLNFVKGTCKYSDGTTFSVPTAPVTAHANTKLLTNFTNASIIDNTMKSNLETVGDAQIDTSIKKFGTGSIQFDGTSDYIQIEDVNNHLFIMGTSDWTLECFAYSNGNQGADGFGVTLLYIGGAGSNNAIWLTQNSSDKLCGRILYNGSSWTLQLTSSASISHNTFYHVAFELYNGTAKVFINGTSEASGSFTADLSSTYGGRLSIGSRNATDRFFNGYLDEVRISRFGRYQGSNFTAPTKSFANR